MIRISASRHLSLVGTGARVSSSSVGQAEFIVRTSSRSAGIEQVGALLRNIDQVGCPAVADKLVVDWLLPFSRHLVNTVDLGVPPVGPEDVVFRHRQSIGEVTLGQSYDHSSASTVGVNAVYALSLIHI